MRVLIAMSGGVDSSVAAALLVKEGHAVEGVTLKLTAGVCCDIGSAQSVCERLGIPHRLLDAQNIFFDEVIGDFIAEYQKGRTPNPCIRCNDRIKFQYLLEYAQQEGFDALATGHYARRERSNQRNEYALKTATDSAKDQSYFLYRLTQAQLRRLLFPIGGMRKTDVRHLARELDLPTAERPESQDICFVADNDYRAFLLRHAPSLRMAGQMQLTDGTVIGTHEGAAFYTIGQRRGLRVSSSERLYVVRIDAAKNLVVLGKRPDLAVAAMDVSALHWIGGQNTHERSSAQIAIRYRATRIQAIVAPFGADRAHLHFQEPVSGVCPGQAAVFYNGDCVLGGGIIENTHGSVV